MRQHLIIVLPTTTASRLYDARSMRFSFLSFPPRFFRPLQKSVATSGSRALNSNRHVPLPSEASSVRPSFCQHHLCSVLQKLSVALLFLFVSVLLDFLLFCCFPVIGNTMLWSDPAPPIPNIKRCPPYPFVSTMHRQSLIFLRKLPATSACAQRLRVCFLFFHGNTLRGSDHPTSNLLRKVRH
jgi:hypothetical protein